MANPDLWYRRADNKFMVASAIFALSVALDAVILNSYTTSVEFSNKVFLGLNGIDAVVIAGLLLAGGFDKRKARRMQGR